MKCISKIDYNYICYILHYLIKYQSGCIFMSMCKLIANVQVTSVALVATWWNLA